MSVTSITFVCLLAIFVLLALWGVFCSRDDQF